MTRNYKKLALHNSVCNEKFFEYQDCVEEHPYAKWTGKCTHLIKEVEKCIAQNRINMRNKNQQLAKERHENIKKNISG